MLSSGLPRARPRADAGSHPAYGSGDPDRSLALTAREAELDAQSTATPIGIDAPVMKLWSTFEPSRSARPIVTEPSFVQ